MLTGWFLDLHSARQLGFAPNGYASRGLSSPPSPSASNAYLAAGEQSAKELIKNIARGFYVTELIGSGVNLLTGDYDAVLQVSASTVNRLLASMHQNDWRNPNTPSFPHSVGIRLGDVVEVDGVRGTAWAQVGVPRITLIDGSTDRFHLEVGLRIRYVPDPGTEPLATYIHGTLGADYELTDIDPASALEM